MYKIAIDGNEANTKDRVGVNTYAYNVLKGLHAIENKKRSAEISYTIFLSEEPYSDIPKETKFWKYKVLGSRKMWILTRLVPHLWLNLGKYDLFFTPSHYTPLFVPLKRVCSIMDLGYLESTDQFKAYDYWQLKLWSAYSMCVSKCIITISTSTEGDIVRHHPKYRKKIKVTHLGYDKSIYDTKPSVRQIIKVKKKHSIVNDYMLFLSTLKPSKNIKRLLIAWSKTTHKKTSLVIAGKKGWLFDEIYNLVDSLHISDSVIFTGFVDEVDKPHLIKGAKAFLLPSLWEGFGLDVLSAMASGVPVLVSNKGSLPEVAGDAGTYVDPENVDGIASNLHKLLSLTKFEYNKLAKKGRKQASKFSWEKTSAETREVLLEAVKK